MMSIMMMMFLKTLMMLIMMMMMIMQLMLLIIIMMMKIMLLIMMIEVLVTNVLCIYTVILYKYTFNKEIEKFQIILIFLKYRLEKNSSQLALPPIIKCLQKCLKFAGNILRNFLGKIHKIGDEVLRISRT